MADVFSYRADRTADKAMEQVIKEGEPVFEVWRDREHPVSRQQARAVLFHALGGVLGNQPEFKSEAARKELVKYSELPAGSCRKGSKRIWLAS
jgi:hypothetical protein